MLDSFHTYPVFPDLLENQRRSIKFFWEKGILDELELFSTIIGYKKEKNVNRTLVQTNELKKKSNQLELFEKKSPFLKGEVHKSSSWVGNAAMATTAAAAAADEGSSRRSNLLRVLNQSPETSKEIKLMDELNQFDKTKTQFSKKICQKNSATKTTSVNALLNKKLFNFFDLPNSIDNKGSEIEDQLNTAFVSSSTSPKWNKKRASILPQNRSLPDTLSSFSLAAVERVRAKIRTKLKTNQLFKAGFGPTVSDLASSPTRKIEGLQVQKNTTDLNPKTERIAEKHVNGKAHSPILSAQKIESLSVLNTQTLFSEVSKNGRQSLTAKKTNAEGFSFQRAGFASLKAGSVSRNKGQIFEAAGRNLLNTKPPFAFAAPEPTQPQVSDRDSIGISGSSPPETEYLVLHGSKFVLKAPYYSQNEAIKFQKTYSVGLFLPVSRKKGSILKTEDAETKQAPFPSPKDFYQQSSKDQRWASEAPPPGRNQEKKSLWFYFGDIPLMTDRGSFIINGAPRVLVNQIIRCPSVYFKVKLDQKNRRTYIASFLSEYGSWLRLETDRLSSRLWARIDKSPRFPADLLLMGLGYNQNGISQGTKEPKDQGSRLRFSVPTEGNGKASSRKIDKQRQKPKILSSWKNSPFLTSSLSPLSSSTQVETQTTRNSGLALQTIWKKCNPGRWTSSLGCYSFFYNKFLNPKRYSIGRVGRLRLNKRLLRNPDCGVPTLTPEDILLAFNYLSQLRASDSIGNFASTLELDDIDHLKNRRVRLPGEILQNQFRLALSRITYSALRFQDESSDPFGRGLPVGNSIPKEKKLPNTIAKETQKQKAHLSDKNLTLPLSPSSLKTGVLNNLIANRGSRFQSFAPPPPIPAFQNTLRELFNTGQLSQYMDQTNPLAEITHKRRLSSLGPGGVGRDQAGFAVREIHPSHFGRICPIETPEGQNAGLVGSLASYARINADGFLQSPGLPIEQQKVHNREGRSKIALFSSELEDEIYVCTGDTLNPSISNEPKLANVGTSFPAFFPVRYKQEFLNLKGTEAVELISAPTKLFTGVCPIQLISIATSLIPFLEHDDANRALMGSNMQRQAVPFMITEKPFVGTGLELQAARDSSTILLSKQSGQVLFVDASCIQIQGPEQQSSRASRPENTRNEKEVFSYELASFVPSNQSTSLKQRPAVEIGEWVEKGFLLADGSATKDGEVSLGKNVLLAYMPWEGYNFEDAIVINERLVFEDIYTSIHVERFEVDVKNTKILSFRNLQTMSSALLPRGFAPHRASGSQQAIMNSENVNPDSSLEGNQLSSFVSLKGSIPPGDYLTGDLDILMGRFDGIQASKNEKESEKRTNSDNLDFLRRPNSLSHLDERGVVKPGTWVQEGDILIGKVQIGAKELQQTSVTGDGISSYGNLNEKTGNSTATTSSKTLPFPEYRLLLAIFDLQNNGGASTKSLTEEKTKGPQVGDQLGTGETNEGNLQENAGFNSSNATVRPIADTLTPTSNVILPTSRTGVIPIISDYPIKNTSFKAGIGVKGRVLECVLDGELFKYPEVKGTPQRSNIKLPQTPGAKENNTNLQQKSKQENETKTRNDFISESQQFSQETQVGLGPENSAPSPIGKVELSAPENSESRSLEDNTNSEMKVFASSSKSKTLSRKTSLDSGKEMCSTVSIFLAHKKRIQLGDKMSGRHGNKGIVSLILPPQDMPYLQDGKPVDVVLNPLGVPSRMNVGQVLETLFGLSAFYSKKEYRIMPFDERINPRIGNQKLSENTSSTVGSAGQTKNLVSIPQNSQKVETSRSLVYGHLKHLRKTIQNGVIAPMDSFTFGNQGPGIGGAELRSLSERSSSTTFDPAISVWKNKAQQAKLSDEGLGILNLHPPTHLETKIVNGNQFNWLFDPNNPGKTQVFDGRTGEIFYQPVLVGYSYMFKLIHLVDDKIHARSTGPYSLVTQQPLGGRSKKGGQRLGEMEVWALQGFGSASILQEFLTVKSDEIYSRNHFLFHLMRRNWSSLDKITFNKGFEQSLEPKEQSSFSTQSKVSAEGAERAQLGSPRDLQTPSLSAPSKLPESFRVLVNELHALCLSVYSNLPN